MDEMIIYKNIESLTLKRDRLLRKLRKLVKDYGRGRIKYSDLSSTLTELRKTRKAYVRIIKEPLNVSQQLKNLLVTLMEFTFVVSVNDERELLERVITLMRRDGIEEALIRNIEEDIKEVDKLSKLVSETLASIRQ